MEAHEGGGGLGSLVAPFSGWLEHTLESHTSANLLIIAVVLVASLPLLGIGFFATRPIAPDFAPALVGATAEAADIPGAASLTAATTMTFACAGGALIEATFADGSVDLSLSDGRSLSLPQTGEGSYSNPDGSFVFERTGSTASVIENGHAAYGSCSVRR